MHPDGVPAQEREQAESRWRRAGLNLPADACLNWVRCRQPALHWEPLYSTDTVEHRQASMAASLDAGADPNELDHELDLRRSLGRPLHCCLGGLGAWGCPRVVRDNAPLIELLLAHGADPRLQGPGKHPSPLELARYESEDNTNHDDGEKVLQECGFYRTAFTLMKAAADSLDSESSKRPGGRKYLFYRSIY